MPTRNRTLIMLGSLMAAMSGTSAFLGWMDPSSDPPHHRPIAAILDEARALVADSANGVTPNWQEVEVLAGPVAANATMLAAAPPDDEPYHFDVDLAARIRPTRHWFANPAAREHAVRIRVQRGGRGEPMSRAQWDCVRALVTVLRETPRFSDVSLPVRLDNTWSRVYELEPESVIHIGPLSVAVE